MGRRYLELTVCCAIIVAVFFFSLALKREMENNGIPTTIEEVYPDEDDPMKAYVDDLKLLHHYGDLERRRQEADEKRRERYRR